MEPKFECVDCGEVFTEDQLLPAKDVLQRNTVGETFSDVECPDCGALCFPYQPEDPVYVLWDSGCLEMMDNRDDAEYELLAAESRGLRGHLYTDLCEAVCALGPRLGIGIHGVRLDGNMQQSTVEKIGAATLLWELHVDTNLPRFLLSWSDSEQLFTLVIYTLQSDHNSSSVCRVGTAEFSDLTKLLRENASLVPVLQARVNKLTAEVEMLSNRVTTLEGSPP